MIDTTPKPLRLPLVRPPLAAPDPKLREDHLNRRLPIANGNPAARNGPPGAPPPEAPRLGVEPQSPRPSPASGRGAAPPASISSPNQAASKPKRFTCRECRVKTPWPAAGWYSLDRRVVPGSVPPDILSEAERRAWARSNRQWLGVYCSLACLRQSLGRLEKLDRMFREKGVGTRLAGLLAERAIDARRAQELGAE